MASLERGSLPEAEASGKPILLSIGYTACHWCHVMNTESFADPEAAALMNENFITIKVDREERPDIDQIYQTAAQPMGHAGGWPLTRLPDARAASLSSSADLLPKEDARAALLQARARRASRAWTNEQPEPVANTDGARRRAARPSGMTHHAGAALDGPGARRRRGASRRSVSSCCLWRASGTRRNSPRTGLHRVRCGAAICVAARCNSRQLVPDDAGQQWPAAGSTTMSAAASTATPSMSAGSFRISRRCSTTTRS